MLCSSIQQQEKTKKKTTFLAYNLQYKIYFINSIYKQCVHALKQQESTEDGRETEKETGRQTVTYIQRVTDKSNCSAVAI